MGIEVFLGEPPKHIKDWIINHSVKRETHIKFTDGTEGDYLIEGAMDLQALIDAGLMPVGSGTDFPPDWSKQPLEVNVGSAVTSIGDLAFYSCNNLTSVTIPDSVTRISGSAFNQCSYLTSVTIGNGVTSIESSTFSGCERLITMSIPDSVTSIGMQAFYACSGLTSVTIGNGVTSIGSMVFLTCSLLTNVTIPDSVTSIDVDAFMYCNNLTSVTITANGGDAANVKLMMINAGVSENITWNMPN